MQAIFIRHAESAGQERGARLTARGVAHAQELAVALRSVPIGRVLSSPFERARQTAEPLAARVPLELEDRLVEWQVPWIPDAEWPQALRRVFSRDAALPDHVEPRDAVIARGLAAFREASTGGAGVPVLVTHGKLLALVLSALGGGNAFDLFTTFRNPHAFEVRAVGSAFEVRSLWHPST